MSVTPTSLSFTQTLGGAVPAAKTLAVSTSSTDIAFNTSVTMDNGDRLADGDAGVRDGNFGNSGHRHGKRERLQSGGGNLHGHRDAHVNHPFTSGSPISVKVTLTVNARHALGDSGLAGLRAGAERPRAGGAEDLGSRHARAAGLHGHCVDE